MTGTIEARPESDQRTPVRDRPAGVRPVDDRMVDERPTRDRALRERPTGERAPGERPTGERAPGVRPMGERSVRQLVHEATEQLSQLVRQEMALAKLELTDKGRRMGRGGGMLGASGALAYIGLIALAATAAAALVLLLPVWAATLTVAFGLLLLAGLLAIVGRTQLRLAVPPKPQKALGSVRADVEEIKERAHHR